MADITIPQFAVTTSLQQRVPTKLRMLDGTDYLTEARADYYLMGVMTLLGDDSVIVLTPDFVDPTLVTFWDADLVVDGVYQTYIVYALAYGQEAVVGTFLKGQITYYNGAFYIATNDIAGSVDPSSGAGADADFVLLTQSNFPTYIGISLYHVVQNWMVKEKGSLCIHNERKTWLMEYQTGQCTKAPSDIGFIFKHELYLAAHTEMSVPEYTKAHDDITLLSDVCDGG